MEARFVVELRHPVSDKTIQSTIENKLGLASQVSPLFEEPDLDLDRFRAIEFPGVFSPDRADLFDVARIIWVELDAVSVEPDLDTRYYDGDESLPDKGTEESANFAFWCWAKDEDKPADRDWAIKKVKLREAWEFSKSTNRPVRGRGSNIFQPDTGVVTSHREIPNGAANALGAANFIERGQPPIDPMMGSGNLGHGTATGSVAASAVSHVVDGAAPQAKLVPLRCLKSVVRFNQSLVAEAVNHARVNGAHVVSMSLGGVPSMALHAAIRRAVDENIIIVAAAGNCVGSVVWPARYAEVIAVGGVNAKDQPWRGSSRGRSVDVSGPAEFVLRADARDPANQNAVGGGQGTSFATAMLAGVAACWLSHHGRDQLIEKLPSGMRLQDLFRAMLKKTATVPSGFDTTLYGAGIVDALGMVSQDPFAAGAEESVSSPVAITVREQVQELLAETGGEGAAESASMAVRDEASILELACIGLDMARHRNASHRRLEAIAPAGISLGFKSSAGRDLATELTGD